MHARLDQLLSLRDGVPVDAGVRRHVDGCTRCARELDRLESLRAQLRALPQVPASAGEGWSAVRERLEVSRVRRRRRTVVSRYAVAASLAALGAFASMRLLDPGTPPASAGRPLIVLESESIEDLRRQSRDLEDLLASLPRRPAVERAGTSVPIEALEAQVQWLDHRLSVGRDDGSAAEAEQLWRDRVEVMNSLVRLRYVEAQQVTL